MKLDVEFKRLQDRLEIQTVVISSSYVVNSVSGYVMSLGPWVFTVIDRG